MSYILDALKRADAERGGDTPLSHSEAPSWASSPKQAPSKRRKLAWAALALLITLAALAYLLWPSAKQVETQMAQAAPAPTASPSPTLVTPATPAPLQASAPVPAPIQLQPMAQSATVTAPTLTPPEMSAAPSSPPQLAQSAFAPAATDSPKPAQEPLLNPLPSRPAPGAPAPQILKRVPLPPAPPLPPARPKVAPALPTPHTPQPAPSVARIGQMEISISGSSYSANPAHRMLIANGKVVKEGQELSPGITLETMGERTAVFNQNGTRFNVNY